MDEIAGYLRCAYCKAMKVPYPLGPLELSEHPVTGKMDYYYACEDCRETNRVFYQFNALRVQRAEDKPDKPIRGRKPGRPAP